MADDLIKFSGSEIEFNGRFFSGDPAKQLKDNLGNEVGLLAKQGREAIQMTIGAKVGKGPRAKYPGRASTGFTARSIEVYQKPRNSLYAKVRVKPNIVRPGRRGSSGIEAERLPYVIMAVLETGRAGGHHGYRVKLDPIRGSRSQRVWVKGARRGADAASGNAGQRGIFAFRRAAKEMRSYASAIRDRVTKDIA